MKRLELAERTPISMQVAGLPVRVDLGLAAEAEARARIVVGDDVDVALAAIVPEQHRLVDLAAIPRATPCGCPCGPSSPRARRCAPRDQRSNLPRDRPLTRALPLQRFPKKDRQSREPTQRWSFPLLPRTYANSYSTHSTGTQLAQLRHSVMLELIHYNRLIYLQFLVIWPPRQAAVWMRCHNCAEPLHCGHSDAGSRRELHQISPS